MYFPSSSFWKTAPLLTSSLQSLGPNSELFILNKVVNPDGFRREAVVAGASPRWPTFPGPIIRGFKGDTFNIKVNNMLTNEKMLTSTTIHWHGIHHSHGTNWADGTAFVTQCPIGPGDSFSYRFPVENQAGTFWYHSHYSTQACDGLRGPLIVMDPNDPHVDLYDIDDDGTVITLSDWYHQFSSEGENSWDSTVINGFASVPGSKLPGRHAVVNVGYGKRYRFRLINMSCHAPYNFTIDKHDLTVIEADGVNVVPVTVNQLQIFAGQRYSVVMHTNQDLTNYWIRVPVANGRGIGGLAILRYLPVPVELPYSRQRIDKPLKESDLHPLPSENPEAPGEPRPDGADVELDLKLGFKDGRFTINDQTFHSPTVPVLTQILNGAVDPREILPIGSVYSLPRNKTIQINIHSDVSVNSKGGPHPFYLHGHTFSVVKGAGNSTYNFDNPIRRDTVATSAIEGGSDQVSIRFVTDNPGPWILHCHIDWHREAGLAVVLAEDIPGIAVAVSNRPDSWNDLCPKYDGNK